MKQEAAINICINKYSSINANYPQFVARRIEDTLTNTKTNFIFTCQTLWNLHAIEVYFSCRNYILLPSWLWAAGCL